MGNAFTDSLVNKTSPAPRHQVLFLSQHKINSSFNNMYLITDDDFLSHNFKRAIRGVGILEGKLGPPFVSLYVSDRSKQLFYVLSFLS